MLDKKKNINSIKYNFSNYKNSTYNTVNLKKERCNNTFNLYVHFKFQNEKEKQSRKQIKTGIYIVS